MSFERLTTINAQAADVAKNISILRHLSWSKEVELEFLSGWDLGRVILPTIQYKKVDYSEELAALKRLQTSFTATDPLEKFTERSIASYIDAAELVHACGAPHFQDLSIKMFGKPGDKIPGSHLTNVEAAKKLLAISKSFDHAFVQEPELCVRAESIAEHLTQEIQKTFGNQGPKVEIVQNAMAKASAGAKTVKLRGGTAFSRYDQSQLLVHEVMTHSLTAINGSAQPILKTLGRGSPRTIATQEGLATFSEVITNAIDLRRLERLALRIIAIDHALKGATFVDTFRFFLNNNQSAKESFAATARIFRGGFPDKNVIFTKDQVYLDGLLKVHTLFRWALMNEKLDLTHLLFCGRMTIEDLFELEPAYLDGYIQPPQFLPAWYESIEGLAGILAFTQVASWVDEGELESYYSRGARDD